MRQWIAGSQVALLACGSFNPPTLMHLRLLEVARDCLQIEHKCDVIEGIMSPVADSFGKPNLVSAAHRLAMVEAAAKGSSWIRADEWECVQKQWTRTLCVLSYHREQIRKKTGKDTELALVVGGDVVESFSRILPNGEPLWKPEDVRDIISEFGLIVIARDGAEPLETLRQIPLIQDCLQNVLIVSDEACPCAVSSTRLRAAVKAGRSLKYATPNDVIEYINRNSLYK